MASSLSKPTKHDLAILEEACGGDPTLLAFFLLWIKKGKNATRAYMEMYPKATVTSAQFLGHRLLKKINLDVVLAAYGLDSESYMGQLKAGMKATKYNKDTYQREPDHLVRKPYHETLGRLLGLETNNPAVAVQINFRSENLKGKDKSNHTNDWSA